MRILVLGSGGREHALVWKLRQSPLVQKIFCAPGNAGTALEASNIPIAVDNIPEILAFIQKEHINFVIPGPELPLTLGIADACAEAGIPCFGPSAYAAQLEGSKAFAKKIMQEAQIPTAAFRTFTDYEAAKAYVLEKGAPIVIKADGLAAGKGVVVAQTIDQALVTLEAMLLHQSFGKAGNTVLLEEMLVGEEASFMAFCCGDDAFPLPAAQDHKAAYDNDSGPNTGGMGAYSPAPVLPESRYDALLEICIKPILRTLKAHGHPFTGVLYAGLMMTAAGPKVIEYNVRFGDPECQPLLMRMQGDIFLAMQECCAGKLPSRISIAPEHALCIVLAAANYPEAYEQGMPISGIDQAEQTAPGKIKVFHAGTTMQGETLVANAGRILGITALGTNLHDAQKNAYTAIRAINAAKTRYRSDIGDKGLKR